MVKRSTNRVVIKQLLLCLFFMLCVHLKLPFNIVEEGFVSPAEAGAQIVNFYNKVSNFKLDF